MFYLVGVCQLNAEPTEWAVKVVTYCAFFPRWPLQLEKVILFELLAIHRGNIIKRTQKEKNVQYIEPP